MGTSPLVTLMDFSDKTQNLGVLLPVPPQTLRVSEFPEHSCPFMRLTRQIGTQAPAHPSLLY